MFFVVSCSSRNALIRPDIPRSQIFPQCASKLRCPPCPADSGTTSTARSLTFETHQPKVGSKGWCSGADTPDMDRQVYIPHPRRTQYRWGIAFWRCGSMVYGLLLCRIKGDQVIWVRLRNRHCHERKKCVPNASTSDRGRRANYPTPKIPRSPDFLPRAPRSKSKHILAASQIPLPLLRVPNASTSPILLSSVSH